MGLNVGICRVQIMSTLDVEWDVKLVIHLPHMCTWANIDNIHIWVLKTSVSN